MTPEQEAEVHKAMEEAQDEVWGFPKIYANCTSFQTNGFRRVHGDDVNAF